MRALITGATGFAGSYLVEFCLAAGMEVHGTYLHTPQQLPPQGTYHQIDVRVAETLIALLRAVQPDRIYHLAAQASVAAAWKDPAATLTDNIISTERLLHAVHQEVPHARVLLVSSSEVYGVVAADHMPVSEDQPLRPVDPYGVSKAAAELLGYQYHSAFGLHVVLARPFNHFGPRQRQGFVLPDFIARAIAIEQGKVSPILQVGNVNTARDFTDVRDVVRAYCLLLEQGDPGSVYNICSGVALPLADLLERVREQSKVPFSIEVDPQRYRPIDRPALIGSATALQGATGWQPTISLTQTVADTIAFWRAHTSLT